MAGDLLSRAASFFSLSLFLWHGTGLVWIVAVLLADMILQVAGDALIWREYAIGAERTLLLAFMHYAEMTLGFAVFYARCDCLDKTPSSLQALYLSAAIATTVGYLPKGVPEPSSDRGLVLVMMQLAVFVLFVLLFINSFLSRADAMRKGRP